MRNDIDAVVFDMDGLLLDSERLAFKAFQDTCKKYHLGDLNHVFMACVGTNSVLGKSILKQGLAGKADFESFDRDWMEAYNAVVSLTPVPLKKGAKELLSYLRSNQIPIAMATSTNTDRANHKLDRSNILTYFDIIVGGDQVTNSKPSPDIYLEAASRLGVPPSSCMAFEDSSNGVKAAVAAGMKVIQIPDLVPPEDALMKLGHTVYESLEEALKIEFKAA